MGQQHSGAVRPTAIEQEVYQKNLGALRSTEIPCCLIQRVEYDGSGNAIYVGYAESGTAESALTWLLFKFTYDGSNQMTAKNAYGVLDGELASWTARASYTYH